jgi:hypothetical protein
VQPEAKKTASTRVVTILIDDLSGQVPEREIKINVFTSLLQTFRIHSFWASELTFGNMPGHIPQKKTWQKCICQV